jgi:mannose-6-phosphate isomerase-like protein (cupin superfamily)
MYIARKGESKSQYEYGCDLRRIYPWPGTCDPGYWGAAMASVRQGEATTIDSHDEFETFIIISGKGLMEIGEEAEVVTDGDVILIPKNCSHRIRNVDDREPLVFLSIFWDSEEAREKMKGKLLA